MTSESVVMEENPVYQAAEPPPYEWPVYEYSNHRVVYATTSDVQMEETDPEFVAIVGVTSSTSNVKIEENPAYQSVDIAVSQQTEEPK